MHCVSKWIENRGRIAIDTRIMPPQVRHRQRNEFRETTWPVHTNTGGVCTQMPHSSHTVSAPAANDVPFPGDKFTRMKVIHVGADFDDLSYKLMPNDHRHRNGLFRPVVPVEDMNVCAADTCAQNMYQHIINANAGFGNILKPKPRFGS